MNGSWEEKLRSCEPKTAYRKDAKYAKKKTISYYHVIFNVTIQQYETEP
jgi:hypothetical protein